ncbi:MAG: matrixin family metalloprotease, partial [Planctomycetota bacterium]
MTRSSKRSWKKWPARDDRTRSRHAGRLFFRLFLILAAFQAGGNVARGYVRMVLEGKVLKWSTSTLSWRLNKTAPPGIADGSHAVALEHAFQAWEDLPGSKVRFNRKANTSSRNVNTSDHIIFFDGNNHSGFFPPGSGIVAITPISFEIGTGRILDADILFNSQDFDFSTDGSPGRYDLQDVAAHEIGHFIGLDHSPLLSSTLWPFVAPRQWLHRSLSPDDAAGGTAVMSRGTDSVLSGRLFKSDASVLKGGLVVAVHAEDGRVAGSVLSDKNGNWTLRGLSAGNFFVYAAPVEGSFQQDNLTGETPLQTDFGVTFYGGFSNPAVHPLGASSSLDCGSLTGRPDSPLLDSAGTPLLIHPGESRPLTLSGAGFPPGGLSLADLSPAITLSGVNNGSNWVQATVTVSPSCPLGTYDLYLTTASGDLEAASGALEVVAPAPVLAGGAPPGGGVGGGTRG